MKLDPEAKLPGPDVKIDSHKLLLAFCGVFLVVCLIYGHEKSSEARAGREAFEAQKQKNFSDRQVAWQQGFMLGAQCSLDSVAAAVANLPTLTTNAQEFVRSNIIWQFNLQRPK